MVEINTTFGADQTKTDMGFENKMKNFEIEKYMLKLSKQ